MYGLDVTLRSLTVRYFNKRTPPSVLLPTTLPAGQRIAGDGVEGISGSSRHGCTTTHPTIYEESAIHSAYSQSCHALLFHRRIRSDLSVLAQSCVNTTPRTLA